MDNIVLKKCLTELKEICKVYDVRHDGFDKYYDGDVVDVNINKLKITIIVRHDGEMSGDNLKIYKLKGIDEMGRKWWLYDVDMDCFCEIYKTYENWKNNKQEHFLETVAK
jgi:hypothetical protein